MSDYIIESGMTFGPLEQEQLFHIEKSHVYRQLGEHVKTVEYIYLKDSPNGRHELQLVEGKSTKPNPANREESWEKEEKYEKDFRDLKEKFEHSVNLLSAVLLGKYEDLQDVGETLVNMKSFQDVRFCFVLVVKNSDESWLAGPKAELERRLLPLRKIWKADVIVLNEDLAKRKGMLAG